MHIFYLKQYSTLNPLFGSPEKSLLSSFCSLSLLILSGTELMIFTSLEWDLINNFLLLPLINIPQYISKYQFLIVQKLLNTLKIVLLLIYQRGLVCI